MQSIGPTLQLPPARTSGLCLSVQAFDCSRGRCVSPARGVEAGRECEIRATVYSQARVGATVPPRRRRRLMRTGAERKTRGRGYRNANQRRIQRLPDGLATRGRQSKGPRSFSPPLSLSLSLFLLSEISAMIDRCPTFR